MTGSSGTVLMSGAHLHAPGARPSAPQARLRATRNHGDLDIETVRQDTPGTLTVTHFNNAGCSLPPQLVTDKCMNWIELEATIGGYEAAEREGEALQSAYTGVARLINCEPEEVAVVQSATQAWQQVFFGMQFKSGDRILTSVAEYGSNYINFLQASMRFGAVIEVIPEDADGDIDLVALEHLLRRDVNRPALVAVTHIPTSSGRVYDAVSVGQLAKAAGVPFLLDACQSVGQMPIDVREIGCDFLTGTGRKYLRAPRGCGFLYASRSGMKKFSPAMLDVWGAELESATVFTMHPTARRYEAYEMSFAAKVGLGVAIEYALSLTIEATWPRIQHLASLLRNELNRIPGVHVLDKGKVLCGIVSFTKDGTNPSDIKDSLAAARVNVSVSMRRSTLLDFDARNLDSVVRASVHYFNTDEEIFSLCRLVAML